QLVLQVTAVDEHLRQRRHQTIDRQLARERALPVARLEQPEHFERAERVAYRSAAHAEPRRQHAFGRQRLVGRVGPLQDQLADPIGNLLVNTGLFDGFDEPGFARAGARSGGRGRLDTRAGEWQTVPPDWFDHRATLAQRSSRNPTRFSRWVTTSNSWSRDRRAPCRARSRSTPSNSGWRTRSWSPGRATRRRCRCRSPPPASTAGRSSTRTSAPSG